ncbi:PilW family protein [Thalassotalea sp. Y01]|uniref:PilW family protein n=1 Tax=Thalassotalea sp. Y01 TaxID=2729613 RepID=UPI00145F6632|nr:PilW family protein [Thalassotalea sp. Y01]NMP14850.1 hypothetical protein [Thalassotalea sp. Y01]
MNIKGFSLVELMISMALGIFILSITMATLASVNKQFNYQSTLGVINDTARFSFTLLEQDLKEVSYWQSLVEMSQLSGSAFISTVTNSCHADSQDWARAIQQSVFATNDAPSDYLCVAEDDYLRGDILTLRGIKHELATAFDPNQLYLKTNIAQSRLYFGRDRSDTTNQLSNASQHQTFSHSFYIGNSQIQCNEQPVPALYWQTSHRGFPIKEELLTGVEHMQITLGLDNNDDNIVDQIVSPNNVANWRNVMHVTVDLLVRSKCPDSQHIDNNIYRLGDINYQVSDNYHRRQFRQSFFISQ